MAPVPGALAAQFAPLAVAGVSTSPGERPLQRALALAVTAATDRPARASGLCQGGPLNPFKCVVGAVPQAQAAAAASA